MHQQILQRAGISHEMFTAAMMANKDDPTVRQLMGQTLRMGELLCVVRVLPAPRAGRCLTAVRQRRRDVPCCCAGSRRCRMTSLLRR